MRLRQIKNLLAALFLLVGIPARIVWAAIPSDTAWEVRTTGSDTTCSGGFSTANKGATGVDYSQANSAHSTFAADLSGVGTTTLTDSAAEFDNTMLGNTVLITGQGTYCIVGFTDTTHVTVDRSLGTFSNGTGYVGGAFASPGMAGSVHTAQNHIYVKAGTYTLSSATANTSGGTVTLTAGVATQFTKISGYNVTRDDLGTAPLLQANGSIVTFTVITCADSTAVENISIDCNLRTSARGVACNARCEVESVSVQKATNNAFLGSGTTGLVHCRATLCTTQVAFSVGGWIYECVADNNSIGGFQSSAAGVYVRDVAWKNANAGNADGFLLNTAAVYNVCVNCTSVGNDHTGIVLGSSTNRSFAVNCISMNNGLAGVGFGYNGSGAAKSARFVNCATFGNAQGDFQTTNIDPADIVNKITLTSDPFIDSTNGDFRLNNLAGGGALLRTLGYYSTMPGLLGSTYIDVGAFQHADPGTRRVPQ